MNNGWIKLHRKFTKWGWYQKSEMVHLFLHFLLLANHDEKEWQGIKIKRGQFATGLPRLNKDTGISAQTLRTCISRLKSTGEITNKSTNKYRLITITKYSDYQEMPTELTGKSTDKLTFNQQTTNRQLTTNKKNKNNKNDKKILIPAHEEVKKILSKYIPIKDIDNKTNEIFLVRLYNELDKDITKVEALCKAVEHFSHSEYPYSIYSIRALYEKKDKIRARVAQEQLKLNNKKPAWITL